MTKSTNWNSSIKRILGGIDTHTAHTQFSYICIYVYISSSNRYLARKVVSAPVTTEEKKKPEREIVTAILFFFLFKKNKYKMFPRFIF